MLPVLGQHVRALAAAKAAASGTVMLQGTTVPLRPGCAVLATMQSTAASARRSGERHEMPASLASALRPTALAAPDLQVICEMMLACAGALH